MPSFIHLSDLHFGRISHAVVEGLLKKLNDLSFDHIIISGDLTQRAKPSEFKAARDFIEQINHPVFVVPGNHDQPASILSRFTRTWSRWQRFFAPETEPVFTNPDYQIIGVNSARPWGWYFDWSRGRINQHQIQRSCSQLNQAMNDEQLQILVAHHPFWLPASQKHRALIKNSHDALKQMHTHGLDIILSGHVHSAFCQVDEGIIVCHAGSTTSTRLYTGEPNSFNVIKGDKKQISIEQMSWNSDQFIATHQVLFQRNPLGSWVVA